jgi:hypothetical protein
MTAPIRKIVRSTTPRRDPNRRGMVSTSILECGHLDWTKASERKRGWVHCFDCFYGKQPQYGPEIMTDLLAKHHAT